MALCTVALALITGAQAYLVWYSFDFARNDQRAWVGPVDMPPPELRAASQLTLILANSGKTPARNVSIRSGTWVLPREEPFREQYRTPTILGVIQPGARVALNGVSDQPFTDDDRQAVSNETKVLTVYGTIFYEDVFGRKHQTTFAREWMPRIKCWRTRGTHNDAN